MGGARGDLEMAALDAVPRGVGTRRVRHVQARETALQMSAVHPYRLCGLYAEPIRGEVP